MKKTGKISFIFIIIFLIILLLPIVSDLIYTFANLNEQKNTLLQENAALFLTTTGFLALLTIIEIISSFTIYDSTKHTIYITMSLLAFNLSSTEAMSFYTNVCNFSINQSFLNIINYFSFILSILFIFYYTTFQYRYRIQNKKLIIILSTFTSLLILYVLLLAFNLEIFINFITIFFILFIYISLLIHLMPKNSKNLTFNVLFIISALIIALYIDNSISLLFSTSFINIPFISLINWHSIYFILIIIFYISIYVFFIYSNVIKAKRTIIFEKQVKDLKSTVLVDQIKPHFIFNNLNTIKMLYHLDIHKGDRAVDLFSNHLRTLTDAKEKVYTSFTNELNIILNYIELINIKTEDQFNLILDIKIDDFNVPILSLEPFVENAIKYSKVNQKEDGNIIISTKRINENTIKIIIEDNGVGFNIKSIKQNSYGMTNAKQRLILMSKATVLIESEINKGTRISIEIPYKKETIDYEDNDN